MVWCVSYISLEAVDWSLTNVVVKGLIRSAMMQSLANTGGYLKHIRQYYHVYNQLIW